MIRSIWTRAPRKKFAIIASATLLLGLTATTLALGASHRRFVNPFTSVSYTDNTTGAVVSGIQNGSGVAMEGIVGNTNGSIGMLGFQDSTTSNGVGMEGLVWGASSTGLYGQALKNTDGTHPSVGLLGTSTSGVGVEGQSEIASGIGVEGVSNDGLSIGQLAVNGGAGVFGTSGNDALTGPALEGETTIHTSANDVAAGIGLAYVANGNNAAFAPSTGGLVYGQNGILSFTVAAGVPGVSPGLGIAGIEQPGNGESTSDENAGVLGDGGQGTGVIAIAGSRGVCCLAGGFPIGLYAMGNSDTGLGSTQADAEFVEAEDLTTDGMFAFGSCCDGTGSGDGRIMRILVGNNPTLDLMRGHGTVNTNRFELDNTANIIITGHITTAGGTLINGRTGNGQTMQSYGARSTVPDLEDFGEAQLTNGAGYVSIDASLSNAIDHRSSYLVFITPEGDSNGLYVTAKTGNGFQVRENAGGHHTLAFSYRIVAKPFGVEGARLAVVPSVAQLIGPDRPMTGRRANFSSLSPYTRLVHQVGLAKAQELLARFKAQMLARQLMTSRLPRPDANGVLHPGGTQPHQLP
jgi:hypothetical protein